MDTKIAQKRVDDLSAAMVDKGLRAPKAELQIESLSRPSVYLRWTDESKPIGFSSQWFQSEAPGKALDEASAFIANLPSPEQARLNEFLGALGKVIDLGKQHGIEADYLNPLVASMKKLSENIITDQRAA